MPKLGQSSFRRILLSQILLLSLPVLLVGEYITYRKARSGLLETARFNLTESATKKAQTIEDWINSTQASLEIATGNVVLQSGKTQQYQSFLTQLQQTLPASINCLQLTNLQTEKVIASTCGQQPIYSIPKKFWPLQKPQDISLYINRLSPPLELSNNQNQISANSPDHSTQWQNQIQLVFSAPVYINQNQKNVLRYALSLASTLYLEVKDRPKSLTGSTVIIDQAGIIIAHPDPEKVGKNIEDEADAERLKSLLTNALSEQKESFAHLFSFDKQGEELLAGYDAISSPITLEKNSQWLVLAIAGLNDALSGLKEIKSLLVSLILCLVIASIIAALYISRKLARPLEKLRDYALKVNNLDASDNVPYNFKIREFDQLADGLNTMVGRLRARAQALEYASKEAQVANRLKNEFLRVISHELRTPLNGIINSITLIKDDLCDDEEEEQEYLEVANKSSYHLLNLVNDILDISLIEEGKLSIMLQETDLVQVLQDAINLQMLGIEQQQLTLSLPPLNKPIIVYADPDKLKQVFLNILSNAIKFNKPGGEINISTRIEFASNSNFSQELARKEETTSKTPPVRYRAIVTIQDTGIGVASEQQEKIFEPFAMVDGSTTRQFGGIGLGLAISRSLIDMMGGSITLDSAGLNEGTSVSIMIPLIETKAKLAKKQHSAAGAKLD